MQPSVSIPKPQKSNWVYVSLAVRDGDRLLKPTHVAYDRLLFADPPRITSTEVELIITNGAVEDRRMAEVLPHDAEATHVPIRLLPGDE